MVYLNTVIITIIVLGDGPRKRINMNFLSIFDVIGPNMVGPSSSHTAGAAAIGLMAGKLCPGKLKKLLSLSMGLLHWFIRVTEQTEPC
jgi:L-serine deaminase